MGLGIKFDTFTASFIHTDRNVIFVKRETLSSHHTRSSTLQPVKIHNVHLNVILLLLLIILLLIIQLSLQLIFFHVIIILLCFLFVLHLFAKKKFMGFFNFHLNKR